MALGVGGEGGGAGELQGCQALPASGVGSRRRRPTEVRQRAAARRYGGARRRGGSGG